MKAQSPKNVESGENLYRCDSSTGHRVAVWRLCVQVVVIVLVEDGAGAGASGALAGPRAPGGAGGKPVRGEGRPLLTPRAPGCVGSRRRQRYLHLVEVASLHLVEVASLLHHCLYQRQVEVASLLHHCLYQRQVEVASLHLPPVDQVFEVVEQVSR